MPTSSLLDRWFAAVRSGDEATFRDICTADVVLFWNGDPAVIPWAGEYKGPDGVAAFFKTLRHHIEYQHAALLEVIDGPDAALITLAGRWRVRDTDRIVEARAANILRYRDGRVAGYEVYNDTARFAAALAAAPT
jgi:ketosteroid isomerase-like protein